MSMKLSIILFSLILVLSSCQSQSSTQEKKNPNIHEVIVQETIQAGSYTYIRVLENNQEKWLAAPSVEPVIGKTYYYMGGMEMLNFKSKELSRTFEKVYFIELLSAEMPKENVDVSTTAPIKPIIAKEDVKITPVSGTITIAELFKNKANYANKTIKIKAKVTKYSSGIMNRNWIHLQDGTEDKGNFDLTITSKNIVTQVGDEIIVEGKVSINKDFGAGYFYAVIIEDAIITK